MEHGNIMASNSCGDKRPQAMLGQRMPRSVGKPTCKEVITKFAVRCTYWAAQKYTSTPGPGFLLKGIQAWIPFKRNPGAGVGVYFWGANLNTSWDANELQWQRRTPTQCRSSRHFAWLVLHRKRSICHPPSLCNLTRSKTCG